MTLATYGLLQKCVDMVAFRCYESKTDGVCHWLNRQAPEIRAEIDAGLATLQLLKNLRGQELVKRLRGKCSGLIQIKFDIWLDDGTRALVRILGYASEKDEFVLLHPFIKTGEPDYGPACRKAFNRQKQVMRDGKRAPRCSFPLAGSS